MLNLVDKFKNVQVKNASLLPWDDKCNLDSLHQKFETTMLQLDEWLTFFKVQDERYPMPGFKVNKYGSDTEPSYSASSPMINEEEPFYNEQYYVGYAYVDITKRIASCRTRYVSRIYSYFEKKYSIKATDNSREILKIKDLQYMAVVEDLRKQFGGINFQAISKQQVIERFRDRIVLRKRVNVKNKAVEISDYTRYSSYGGMQFEYDNKDLPALDDAMTLYEDGATKPYTLFTGSTHYQKPAKFDEDYDYSHRPKLDAIRFYQNGKVTLKFKTADDARGFYEYFDLSTLKESYW